MKASGIVLAALVDGCATTGQLAERHPDVAVAQVLRVLRDRQLVRTVQGVHELTPKGRAWAEAGLAINHGPKPGRARSRAAATLRAKAWRYLRIKGKASLDDMLLIVADGTEVMAEQNLRRYLTALTMAGVLVRTRSGWMLPADRNTGIEAPSWNTKTRLVTDVNTGESWRI